MLFDLHAYENPQPLQLFVHHYNIGYKKFDVISSICSLSNASFKRSYQSCLHW